MRRLVAPLGALALSLTLLSAPPAHAAVEKFPIGPDNRIDVVGHGYGHGKGMSQYGALGAAREGLGVWQILDFYYPGTRVDTIRRPVWVQVSEASRYRALVIRDRSHLRVRDHGVKRTHALQVARARKWRLVPRANGRTRVDVKVPGQRWQRHRVLRGTGHFAAGGRPITLRVPGVGWKPYRGKLLSIGPTKKSRDRDVVNVLSLEKYLRGVVPTEMPATWDPAAVQAQSVAARTYAAHQLQDRRAPHYQICDTTACQVYGGVDAEHPAATRAIRATRKRILTYGGSPAFTQFSSSNGGHSAPGNPAYQRARPDPYDKPAINPNHDWRVRLSRARIHRQWPQVGRVKRVVVLGRDGHGDWGGRVNRIRVVGSKGRVTMYGDTFRFALGLKSTYFTLR